MKCNITENCKTYHGPKEKQTDKSQKEYQEFQSDHETNQKAKIKLFQRHQKAWQLEKNILEGNVREKKTKWRPARQWKDDIKSWAEKFIVTD